MNIPLFYVVCGLVGYFPPGPRPEPKPPIPVERFLKMIAFGVIGGVVGGFVAHYAIGLAGPLESLDAVVMLIAAAATGKAFQAIGDQI